PPQIPATSPASSPRTECPAAVCSLHVLRQPHLCYVLRRNSPALESNSHPQTQPSLFTGHEPLPFSLISQCLHRVHAHRSPRRNVTRDQRDAAKQNRDARERQRVRGTHAEKH